MTQSEFCKETHKCARCGKDVTCNQPLWACPWINHDEDDMCEECLDSYSDEMAGFLKISGDL